MTWIIPPSGSATLTHYDLPLNFLASCGCSYGASYYPTAALSSLAYSGAEGSTMGPGPACGRCFRLSLVSASSASPPFVITSDHPPSVVVKVVDKCPSPQFCSASKSTTNQLGQRVHFDLALPSPALNLSFFPSNLELYGYSDFGVWNINYKTVSCEEWDGWRNGTSLDVEKSYPGFEDSCCPINPPYTNQMCSQSLKSTAPVENPTGRKKKSCAHSCFLTTKNVLIAILFQLVFLFYF